MSSTSHGVKPYYFVPEPSRHPAVAALGSGVCWQAANKRVQMLNVAKKLILNMVVFV